AEHEDADPEQEHRPTPKEIGQLPVERATDRGSQQVGRERPRIQVVAAEIRDDPGKRGSHDRLVEGGEEDADHHRAEDPHPERLEVSPRTIRNDIERLRALGYPVHATRGSVGGYRLEAGATLPPLLLEDDEAVAVAIGLRTATGGAVTGIEETSLRALAKLEQ